MELSLIDRIQAIGLSVIDLLIFLASGSHPNLCHPDVLAIMEMQSANCYNEHNPVPGETS